MKVGKEKVRDIVRNVLGPDQIRKSIVYWESLPLGEGREVNMGLQKFAMPFRGTVAFVDLAPMFNWAHPCLYILVNEDTLNTKVIEGSFPPITDETGERYEVILRFGEATG